MDYPKFPKISLVTPSFNQGQFLEECIDSVLSQNYPNLEYIIMDGGSNDNSVEIIKKHSKHLAFWKSESDKGQYFAINDGLNKCSGDIMGWLNSDDLMHHNAFFKIAWGFQEASVKWISCRHNFKRPTGPIEIVPEVSVWNQFIQAKELEREHFIQQESTFWRQSLWREAGAYIDTNYNLAADFELWFRFFKHARLHTLNELISAFREQPDQRSVINKNDYLDEAKTIVESCSTLDNSPPPPVMKIDRNSFRPYSSRCHVKPVKTNPGKSNSGRIPIITSIAPKGIDKQKAAVDSWVELGFEAYSINTAYEINILKKHFKNVNFVEVSRNARIDLGYPLIYLDDLLTAAESLPGDIIGIVNSDIILKDNKKLLRKVLRVFKKGIIYGNRVDFDTVPSNWDGEIYYYGFDYFFMDKETVKLFPHTSFALGAPWWDYWILVQPVLEKRGVYYFNERVAYHKKHPIAWDWNIHARLLKEVVEASRLELEGVNHIDFGFANAGTSSVTEPFAELCRSIIYLNSKLIFQNKLQFNPISPVTGKSYFDRSMAMGT